MMAKESCCLGDFIYIQITYFGFHIATPCNLYSGIAMPKHEAFINSQIGHYNLYVTIQHWLQ